SRAVARQRELAVRSALGAARGRLLRQLVIEAVLLALAGGGVALVLARGGGTARHASVPPAFARFVSRGGPLAGDPATLAFTFAISCASGVIFSLVPAFRLSRSEVAGTLREETRGASRGAHGTRLRNMLVVAEVTLALVLLTGATLLVRSF